MHDERTRKGRRASSLVRFPAKGAARRGPARRMVRLATCADVAALMLRSRRSQLETVIRRSLAEGLLPRRFFEEVMIHLSLVLGFPHMLQGLELLASVSEPASGQLLTEKGSRRLKAKGLQQFQRVYGPQSGRVLSFLDSLKSGTSDWILENVYGRVYARPGLSLAEREVLTIVALNYHGHTKQLTAHLRGALRSGLSLEDLRILLVRLRTRHGMQTAKALMFLDQIQDRPGSSRRRGHKELILGREN